MLKLLTAPGGESLGVKLKSFLTLCILMDVPIQIHMIMMGLSIIYFKGSQVRIFK